MSQSDTQALRRRLGQLEAEHARTCAELATGGGGGETRLSGLFLVVEVFGGPMLVPAAMVAEVVRVVACTPLAGAPAHLLGSFLYRGTQAVAIDLSRLLGSAREPSVEARMLVLSTSRPVGLVVERVSSLQSDPAVADWSQLEGERGRWAGSALVSGLCRAGASIAPLLDVSRVLEGAAATRASGE